MASSEPFASVVFQLRSAVDAHFLVYKLLQKMLSDFPTFGLSDYPRESSSIVNRKTYFHLLLSIQ